MKLKTKKTLIKRIKIKNGCFFSKSSCINHLRRKKSKNQLKYLLKFKCIPNSYFISFKRMIN